MAVMLESDLSFDATVARLTEAIEAKGNTVFAVIDQAAAARTVGATLRPTALIIFGNPKAGTPLMDAFPLAALDLPLKFLVWEDDERVCVAYTPASKIAARYEVSGKDALIAAMDAALAGLAESVHGAVGNE